MAYYSDANSECDDSSYYFSSVDFDETSDVSLDVSNYSYFSSIDGNQMSNVSWSDVDFESEEDLKSNMKDAEARLGWKSKLSWSELYSESDEDTGNERKIDRHMSWKSKSKVSWSDFDSESDGDSQSNTHNSRDNDRDPAKNCWKESTFDPLDGYLAYLFRPLNHYNGENEVISYDSDSDEELFFSCTSESDSEVEHMNADPVQSSRSNPFRQSDID